MALRIKSRWHKSGRNITIDKSIEDQARALSCILWRVVLDRIKNMEGEKFYIDTPPRTIEVAVEFAAFLIHAADRLAYSRMEDSEREQFMLALANHIADTVCENLTDIFGPNDYYPRVIEKLEERSEEYTEFAFPDDEPGYPFLGYFGKKIEEVLGKQHDRWAKEHMMEIEGPLAFKAVKKAMGDLFSSIG